MSIENPISSGPAEQKAMAPAVVASSAAGAAFAAQNRGFPGFLRRLFSFPVFLAALLVGGLFATLILNLQDVANNKAAHTSAFVEGDTWWHLAVGEQILSSHTWPTQDFYSFTAHGNDWIAYEWLGEVPMTLAWRVGGLRGLAALLIALTSTLLLLL